ncbi:MAG: thioredoxin family protein [Nitrosomonadales bacterium]|jgi:thioredoxin 1|uniref:Thioredoxin n=1 Tax=Methylophilales bacterium HTCC2181 TaxID=383631 RepID=A0P7K8_9PROT|nr:thioredoxin [Methylophilales bacterium HTCC2181]MBT6140655.1 thioredoxin family protein [Nitrosomonadales bacterium]|tara:strand:- start:4929 stop:5306 length:378 start_codon:yes stop_codon:yes gene_type:complete
MTNLVVLTKDNFKKTIEDNNFVIVDFWAPWCDPCLAFTPIFEAAAKNNTDIIFGMVDTEKDPEISEYFQVEKIPGLLVIREKAGIHAQVGEIGAPAFDEIIKWARDYDMSTVQDFYKKEDNNELS